MIKISSKSLCKDLDVYKISSFWPEEMNLIWEHDSSIGKKMNV